MGASVPGKFAACPLASLGRLRSEPLLGFGKNYVVQENMTTILIVDDDRKITDMLRRTLSYEGYRVVTAADGEEALVKAQAERPDLVVLDWLMPRLNGLETARLLRESSPVPILMLTARDAIEQRVEGLNSGADDYLVKPFAPEELTRRVAEILNKNGLA